MSAITDTLKLTSIFAAIAFSLGLGCAKMGISPIMTDSDGAKATVEKAGFNEVKTNGYGWFSCGIGQDSDVWRTDFTAKNPKGEDVSGTVCEGILKGSTLRFD